MSTDLVLLMSGGLDSGLLAYDLASSLVPGPRCRLTGLFIDYDQPAALQEGVAAREQARDVGVELVVWRAPIPFASGDDSEHGEGTIVPGRNAVLLSLGVSCALELGATRVLFGANADDAAAYPDCRPEFIAAFNDLAVKSYGVTVGAPLVGVTKQEIARRAKGRLAARWSCYRGGPNPCGECAACRD